MKCDRCKRKKKDAVPCQYRQALGGALGARGKAGWNGFGGLVVNICLACRKRISGQYQRA